MTKGKHKVLLSIGKVYIVSSAVNRVLFETPDAIIMAEVRINDDRLAFNSNAKQMMLQFSTLAIGHSTELHSQLIRMNLITSSKC